MPSTGRVINHRKPPKPPRQPWRPSKRYVLQRQKGGFREWEDWMDFHEPERACRAARRREWWSGTGYFSTQWRVVDSAISEAQEAEMRDLLDKAQSKAERELRGN